MINCIKFMLILFAGMLTFGSMDRNIDADFHQALMPEREAVHSTPYSLMEVSLVKTYALHQVIENLVNSQNHFPTPGSKYHPIACGLVNPPVENQSIGIAAQYFFARKASPLGLGIRDIIFPFHYFW